MKKGNKMKKLVLLLSIIFLSIGCDGKCPGGITCDGLFGPDESEPNYMIDIYSELPLDENGYYHFDYPDDKAHTYSNVKYKISPSNIVRVWWSSPDSFYVDHQGMIFGEPIINYSTYSDEDGTGTQLFYIYDDFIGDTLSIYGFAGDQHVGIYDTDGIKVIID